MGWFSDAIVVGGPETSDWIEHEKRTTDPFRGRPITEYGIGGLIKKHGGKLLKKGIEAGKAKAKEAIVDKIKDKVAEEVGKIVKKQIGLRKGGKVTKRRSKKAAKKRAKKRRR